MSHPPFPRHVARIVDYLSEHGPTSASNATLASELGVTERSVRYGIADGADLGVLTVERRAANPVLDPTGRTIALAVSQ